MGHARGEVELERKVLVLKRIRVTYTGLQVDEADRRTVERVLSFHADGCPVARSLQGAIEITTELGGTDPGAGGAGAPSSSCGPDPQG